MSDPIEQARLREAFRDGISIVRLQERFQIHFLRPLHGEGTGMNNPTEQARQREAFRESISIVRLEGWEPKADFYALQERVIRGELTIDEAVKIIISAPYP